MKLVYTENESEIEVECPARLVGARARNLMKDGSIEEIIAYRDCGAKSLRYYFSKINGKVYAEMV